MNVMFRTWLQICSISILLMVLTMCANRIFQEPVNLRCEYQTNPIGIDVLKPRLFWYVNDRHRGAVQTAYQVMVATSEKLLRADNADVWDSGKIDSDQSAHVEYTGPALKSRQRYFWKVRTWDAAGQPSPWSDGAWWEMGLLHADDWKAQWIGKKIVKVEKNETEKWPWGYWIWHPTEIGVEKTSYYRKMFRVPADKQIEKATLRATADNKYTAYINGRKLGGGAVWQTIDEFPVGKLLKPGTNIIAVDAMNTLGDVCGLLVSLKIEFSDGSTQVINSDKSWRTTTTKKTGWQLLSFVEKSWKKVKVLYPYDDSDWGLLDDEDPYIPPRSTIVRKEFTAKKKIKQARAYVTGLGSYVMHINGQRVGTDVFTPGWTDYPTRIQYQTYDVTSLLEKGANTVGAMLGNVWWSGGLGWRGSNIYSEGPLRFFLQLEIEYTDGSNETIVTDHTWRTHDAPILENSIYNGETYDARLEMPGWDMPNFDETDWESVIVLEPQDGKLVAQQGPTLHVTEEIQPVSVTQISDSMFVFDMGQNMVGKARLKVKGPAGTVVTMRFAETLKDDGTIYTANLRGAKATDRYTLKGEGTEIWEPQFTYHGFRYVEVTGYPGTPRNKAILGKVFHSNPPVAGHFTCSNDLLNQIQHNINWGLRGNLYSVPTDCPQRDERLGWMGDAQIFAPTASYNRNMARFFSKWMRDIIDCQDNDGAVHDVNPAIVVKGPAKPGWGDAVVVVPWLVYQFYGDTRIIEENYEGMAGWIDYMQNNAKGYMYDRKGYGDWIAVVESPSEPIGAAYFYYSTKLLAQMAAIIGKDADAQAYNALAGKIADAFNKKYLNPRTAQYKSGTQTANLLPLAFGITPDDDVAKVIANVVQDIRDRDMHLSTGFLGTGYMLPMLSDLGYHDLAMKLAVQRSYPSWGHMVEKGATTIWELWDSDTEGPSMNSRNHFALGSVGEWYFSHLAGLRPDPKQPGFKHAIIKPMPGGDLTWAEASVETAYGLLKSKWTIESGAFMLDITIPANTNAEVHIPKLDIENPMITEGATVVVQDGKATNSVEGVELQHVDADVVVMNVGAGSYRFEVKNE